MATDPTEIEIRETITADQLYAMADLLYAANDPRLSRRYGTDPA
jgi:hypothetical protein